MPKPSTKAVRNIRFMANLLISSQLNEIDAHTSPRLSAGASKISEISAPKSPFTTSISVLLGLRCGDQHLMCVHSKENAADCDQRVHALQELLADALATGAALHVVHVTSMGIRQ